MNMHAASRLVHIGFRHERDIVAAFTRNTSYHTLQECCVVGCEERVRNVFQIDFELAQTILSDGR